VTTLSRRSPATSNKRATARLAFGEILGSGLDLKLKRPSKIVRSCSRSGPTSGLPTDVLQHERRSSKWRRYSRLRIARQVCLRIRLSPRATPGLHPVFGFHGLLPRLATCLASAVTSRGGIWAPVGGRSSAACTRSRSRYARCWRDEKTKEKRRHGRRRDDRRSPIAQQPGRASHVQAQSKEVQSACAVFLCLSIRYNGICQPVLAGALK